MYIKQQGGFIKMKTYKVKVYEDVDILSELDYSFVDTTGYAKVEEVEIPDSEHTVSDQPTWT